MSGKSLLQAVVRWHLALMFAVMATLAGAGPAMAQHTSVDCPVQNATVEQGSAVEIDVTDCDPYNFGFGFGVGNYRNGPSHGSAIFRQDFVPPSTAKSVLIYTHNGNAATSDSLEFQDLDNRWVRVQITITPAASAIVVAPTSLPTLTAGTSITQTLAATGGSAPYTYSLSSGTLPIGLSLSSGGVLSGTPTRRGGYSFVLRAQDSGGAFVSKAYSGVIQNPTLTLSPDTYNVVQGVSTTFSLATAGGVGPHSYQTEPFVGLAPAPGMAMSSSGVISGTPTTAGPTTTSIRVTDASTGLGSYFELESLTINVVAAPTVSIAVAPASVSEDGATNLVYTVTRSTALASATTVNITTSGSAASGSDYTGGVATVTIPANAASASITLDPTVDATSEADETVILTVAAGTGYTVGAPSAATATIVNDDNASVSITVAPTTVPEDGATNLTYTVTRSAASTSALTVNLTTAGTAASGNDYTGAVSTVTIPANATTATVVIDPTADGTIEPDETVIVTVAAGPGYTVGAPNAATGTIVADEVLTLAVSPTALNTMTIGAAFTQTLSASGGTGPYSFTVDAGALPTGLTLATDGTLSGTPTRRGAYSVTVRVQDSLGAIGGQTLTGTVPNHNVVTTPSTLTFTLAVPASATLTSTGGVAPYSGYLVTSGTMPAGLTLASNGTISGTPTTLGTSVMTLRFRDASTPGTLFQNFSLTINIVNLPTVSVAVSPANTAEDGVGNLIYTVTRDVVVASPLTVNLTTSGTATSGSDYTGSVASVTIPANAASATVTIDPAADAAIEPNETVILTITADSAYLIGTASATGTISNDDFPTASIAVTPASAAEDGSTNMTVTVTLNAAATAPISVNYILGGTATSGQDYALLNTPLSIPSGATSGTIIIDPNQDGTIEPDETVIVTLAAGSGYQVGSPASTTATILNDDLPSIFIDDINVAEGSAGTTAATFTISLSAPATASGVTFDIATLNSTAISGQDFVAANQTGVTIAPGSNSTSFTVAVNGDLLNELDESFRVELSNVVGANEGGLTGTATITNDDGLPTVSIANLSMFEGNLGVSTLGFQIVLSQPSGQTVTLDVATANGSATAGSDYVAAVGNFAFQPGETTKQFLVQVNADTIPEANEQFNVSLTNVVNATVGTGTGTGTIVNDDVPVTIAPNTLPAGGVGTNYSQTLTASGGTGPYGYSLTAGTLPTGLTLGSGGVLSGTPVAAGNFNFTVTTTDSSAAPGPYSGSQAYAVAIAVPTIVLAPSTLPNATFGVPYSQNISASGSVGPYSFAVTSGILPQGLTLAADGTLSGTPTRGGSTSFTVTATDATPTGYAGGWAYTFTVDVPPIVVPPTTLPAGGTGTAYTAQIASATGGVAPYTYAVTSGALPDGLTMSSSGAISGTPIAAGNFNFTVTATDSSAAPGPNSGSQAYTVAIAAPTIALAPSTLPNPAFGVPYSQNVSASGSVGPYSFAVTSGTLPQGLTLAADGTLSGTPTRGGSTTFTVTATDATPTGYAGARDYTVTVDMPPLVLPPTTLPAGGTDIAYTAQIAAATGGVAPYTYAVTSGELPYGLTMSPSGAISGTPTTANLFSFVVTATDSNTGSGPSVIQQSYSINITNTPPVANPVSATIPYGAGLTPITLDVSGRTSAVSVITQPTHGRAFAAGMTISYIPDTGYSGPDSFTYAASNFDANSAPATVTITVADPAITVTPVGPLTATVGSPYSQTLTFNGGTQPWSNYQITGLPSGLQSGSSGGNTLEIVGTPTGAGSFPLTISATDASTGNGPFTVSRSVTLNVNGPNLVLTPGSGSFSVGFDAPLLQSIVASGGIGGYSYAVTAGALPAGIAINGATGLLSGRTTSVGTSNFTITATDDGATGAGAPFAVNGSYVLTVSPPVISFDQTSLAPATVALPYNQTITASGGLAPYSFAVTAGALPAGVNLSSGGVLSGTPTAGGNFTFTVTATDASGAPGPFSTDRQFTLSVGAPTVLLPTTALASGQVATTYSAALNPATGGIAPYSYAVTGGSLPAGIGLSSSGTLFGLPTAFGSFTFDVTATDSSTGAGPFGAVQSYTLVISEETPVANSVSVTLAYGSGNTPVTLSLSGGAATSVAVASPPANGTASASGTTISYQPNASFSGTDSFTYTATNASGTSAPATVTITVGAPALTITASDPLSATVGANYSQTFSFAGGTAPFGSHQVTGLPAGLALTGTTANSVTISGTPRSQGTFTLSVSASDSSTGSGPFVASQSFTLTVAAPSLAISPALGSFASNYAAPFSQGFTASGGIGPYSYALGGTLPAGLTLNPGLGTVSGTPTITGSFNFTVTATDTGASGAGAPFTVQASYTLTVAAPTIAVTPAAIAPAIAGTAYSVALGGSGAVAPYSFALGTGTLPAGVTLSATGILSGTPTASGSFPFNVTVRDANGQTGAAGLTLVVNAPTITITPATLPVAVQGIAYNQTFTASGGIAPYRFAVSTGNLPAGLVLNTTTGLISGTPTASGTANFAITASDSTGGTPASVTVTYALQVTARPDPANDPEVRGLVQAQAMATRRFADAQVNNFMRRLEGLHGSGAGGGGSGFQNRLRFATPGYCQDSLTAWTNDLCAESESKLGPVSAANSGETSGSGTGAVGGSDEMPWTIWAGGTIRFGDRDPATGRLSQKFESEGITFGGDYRFSPSFAAGLGVGLGRDTVDIGEKGSRSRGEAKTIAIYGSHQLGGGIYFDWLGGYQTLDFDLRRYVTPTGQLVNSNRSGRQWFSTVSTGADFETGNWLITPYARIDLTRGRLNGYTENSGSVFDLTFLDQDVDFTSLGLGTRINYRHIFKGGALLPRLRIEYQYDLERNANARVTYFDLVSGPFSTVPLTGLAREQLILGAGAKLQLQSALALEFEYLNRIVSGSGSDQSVQVGLKYQF